MPRYPRGEKRPADMVGTAIKVARTSIGEEGDEREPEPTNPAAILGKRGGAARAKKLSPERRQEIAREGRS